MSMHSLIPVVLLALSACTTVSTTSRIDEQLGDSLRMLKAQQIVNPDASANPDPVKGLDGKAARAALENYQESLRKPAAPSALESLFGGAGAAK